MSPAGPEVDWSRPWLAPWRELGEKLYSDAKETGVVHALNHALSGLGAKGVELSAGPVRFVAQHELPRSEPYEAFIARTACVPTRDNLHDFFNGLAWMKFPRLKRRLNELQADQLANGALGSRRGAVRDALTLFDENSALFQAPSTLIDALRRRDWHELFVERRAEWRDAHLTLFGHALLEKLVSPRKPITAHVWAVEPGVVAEERVVQALEPVVLQARPFLPLPVLGVPGWWAENEAADFYADETVFRRAKAQPAHE